MLAFQSETAQKHRPVYTRGCGVPWSVHRCILCSCVIGPLNILLGISNNPVKLSMLDELLSGLRCAQHAVVRAETLTASASALHASGRWRPTAL